MIMSKEEKNWGMLCHLSALSTLVVPFGSILGPLVVWLIKRNEYPFVDQQGKEALNFQITLLIPAVVALLLTFVFIGIFIWIALGIYFLVMVILASIKTSNGEPYRYPYTIRFIQ